MSLGSPARAVLASLLCAVASPAGAAATNAGADKENAPPPNAAGDANGAANGEWTPGPYARAARFAAAARAAREAAVPRAAPPAPPAAGGASPSGGSRGGSPRLVSFERPFRPVATASQSPRPRPESPPAPGFAKVMRFRGEEYYVCAMCRGNVASIDKRRARSADGWYNVVARDFVPGTCTCNHRAA